MRLEIWRASLIVLIESESPSKYIFLLVNPYPIRSLYLSRILLDIAIAAQLKITEPIKVQLRGYRKVCVRSVQRLSSEMFTQLNAHRTISNATEKMLALISQLFLFHNGSVPQMWLSYAATASMTPMPKLVCEPTFVYADSAMRREKMRVASAPRRR